MKILISHASEDEKAASLLKELIERCSLRRIEVWFSSDQSGAGGISLGASWFTNLLTRLSETDMLVALVTPNSISSPWLFFECGFVANKGKASIVPLTLGMPVSELPMPLSAYQGHDLSSSQSVPTFMQKLFSVAAVPFDDDMTKAIRDNIARQLLVLSENFKEKTPRTEKVEKNDLDQLRHYLDKRFLELHERLHESIDESISKYGSVGLQPMPARLQFDVVKGEQQVRQFEVEFSPEDAIQDILNECYFKLDDFVKPYQYLQQWIIKDTKTGKRLMSAGHNDDTPAISFFDSTRAYTIELLKKPLVAKGAFDQ